ncbi:MAG: HNH endonuclease [Verrucomicrobia bacterium]|nr:HNH endonuclease [Verrucomicrobiota bacterium]
MSNEITRARRRAVAARAYQVCEYCLMHEDDVFWGFETDHIISRKHDGTTTLDNLAWACVCCNRNKGTDIAALAGEPPRLTRLFHPRHDAWLEHFALQQIEIYGLTGVGAGTSKLLKFNDESRLKERFLLREVGRYPTVEALARMKE